ncbi:hypothetical protein EVAR_84988_1 [Eumeta japonica]|uniref:Uncharacterized protein n=1 Tax=Eumeta variegata TaxID=151549 RepID=A0A4C1W7P9_EUMVA|nr:hypothetical protein EVAR_84988_1 [Eumeta japonica]
MKSLVHKGGYFLTARDVIEASSVNTDYSVRPRRLDDVRTWNKPVSLSLSFRNPFFLRFVHIEKRTPIQTESARRRTDLTLHRLSPGALVRPANGFIMHPRSLSPRRRSLSCGGRRCRRSNAVAVYFVWNICRYVLIQGNAHDDQTLRASGGTPSCLSEEESHFDLQPEELDNLGAATSQLSLRVHEFLSYEIHKKVVTSVDIRITSGSLLKLNLETNFERAGFRYEWSRRAARGSSTTIDPLRHVIAGGRKRSQVSGLRAGCAYVTFVCKCQIVQKKKLVGSDVISLIKAE